MSILMAVSDFLTEINWLLRTFSQLQLTTSNFFTVLIGYFKLFHSHYWLLQSFSQHISWPYQESLEQPLV